MPRGIREVKHTRVLFGDLGYAPDQNPYKPEGIRKMSDAWIDPDGDGYVSMVPGYSSLVDLGVSEATVTGVGLSKNAEDINWWATTYSGGTGFQIHRLYPYISAGSINSESVATLASAVPGSALAGKLPMFSFNDSTTNRVYFFTTGYGTSAAIGAYYDVDTAATGTIGLARPDIATGDDTGAAASSALNAAGGAVKGIVKYFISYTGQDGTDEGALSLEFGEIDAGDGYSISLTNLPTLSTNKARLYRTFSDGNQPFYIATLDAATTSYTDNIADVDLGDLPLKMGDPPDKNFRYSAATWHYGRAYILGTNGSTGEQRIYFSDPGEPESYYTSQFGNWFNINDGIVKTGLGRTPSGLVLFGARGIYFLRGRTPADLIVQEPIPVVNGEFSTGCGTPGSFVETPVGIFFYDVLDFSVLLMGNDGGVNQISDDIRNDLRQYATMKLAASGTEEYNSAAVLAFDPRRGNVIVSTGGAGDTIMWIYNLTKRAWIGKATYAPAGVVPVIDQTNRSFTTMGPMNEVQSGGYGGDEIFEFFSGTDHDGTAISAPTVGSPTFTGSDPTLEKTFLYVDILMKGEASKSVTVNWFIDGATTADGTATVTLTGTDARERHRVNIGERGRELDIDVVLDNSSVDHGIYGIVYGYTEDTSVVGS